MNIPQADPKAAYLVHRTELDAAIRRVLAGGWYILGKEVEAFESEFAAWVGVCHACGVGNGTDAIEIALRACGVGVGDGVFTVSHTAVATVAAIERIGAVPIMVDIDPTTYTMDPASLEKAIESVDGGRWTVDGVGAAVDRRQRRCITKPKAIVPVHLYGHPCDMVAIMALAKAHGLKVVEDCAQAHGAEILVPQQPTTINQQLRRRRCGTFGDMAAFSFYPTKNLGALGDAGAVVTGDPLLAERVRLLRQYGWKERFVSDIPGVNSRLDELQAAILRVKLPHLDAGNARRRALAAQYDRSLAETGVGLPCAGPGVEHVYHQYVIRSHRRDELREHLKREGIGTLVHYPQPVHRQPAYRNRLPIVVPLTVTEQAAREVLSLPMYPELSDDEALAVCTAVVRWAAGGK